MFTSSRPTNPAKDDLFVGHYCVSFIDLLGQRDALRNQSLLPEVSSEADKQKLLQTFRDSIGAIAGLQRNAEEMLEGSDAKSESPLRAQLVPEQQVHWDEMMRTNVTTQRWSDGLMSFSRLGDAQVKCDLNNIFRLFALAGTLCFMGLATHRPIRGAIEIAWGVELHPGELYGAAVARAYELESEVAGYPRIVIGTEVLKFLDLQRRNPSTDLFSQNNRTLADLCSNMIVQDADGHWILHYLGDTFHKSISQNAHADLYGKAREFVVEQFQAHQKNQVVKLAFRYAHLLNYFEAHPLPQSASANG